MSRLWELDGEQERPRRQPQPSEEAFLRSEVEAEKARRRRRPPKGTEGRRCLFLRTDGRRCHVDRYVKKDGSLAPTCRTHGPKFRRARTPEERLRQLRRTEAALLFRLNEVKRALVVTIRDHMTSTSYQFDNLAQRGADFAHLVSEARGRSARDPRQGQVLNVPYQRLLPFPGKDKAWMRRTARPQLITLPQDTEYVSNRPTPIYPKPY